MCALWTKETYPDDPEILKIYLPRNLSCTTRPTTRPALANMQRLYLWKDPPVHNLCSFEVNGSLNKDSVFCEEESLINYSYNSQQSIFNNQAIIIKPEVLSDETCSNGYKTTEETFTDKDEENSASHVTINFQNSKSILSNQNQSGESNNSTDNSSSSILELSAEDKTRLSPIYQENDLDRLSNFVPKRRSSSLRSVKDAATTPVRKAVRFADAFGLDLEKVNHIFNNELSSNSSFTEVHHKRKLNYFILGFSLATDKDISYREALNKCLTLENCMVDKCTLTGTIRLKSLTIQKHVFVRITYDDWATFSDIQASYVQDSFDGLTDRFSFVIILPKSISVESKIAFAICYSTNDGQTFWDNNHGSNYTIDCISRSVGSNTWMHFI